MFINVISQRFSLVIRFTTDLTGTYLNLNIKNIKVTESLSVCLYLSVYLSIYLSICTKGSH